MVILMYAGFAFDGRGTRRNGLRELFVAPRCKWNKSLANTRHRECVIIYFWRRSRRGERQIDADIDGLIGF